MSNSPDTGEAEEDKKTSDLLALLYPEDGAEVDASLYEGDEELAGFRDLRAMLADTSDEEPAAAISNKLLALAAQHAPKPKAESRGVFAWLGDLMMPLVAHPGLAAAATLVLVAGVAGTLYVKGDAKLAEPTASSRGQRPENNAAAGEQPALAPDPESSMPATETLAEEFADESPAELVEGALEQSEDGTRARVSRDSTAEKSKSKKRDKGSKAKPAVVGGSTGSGYGYSKGAGAAADEKREAPARSTVRKDSLKVKDIDTRDFAEPSNNPSAGNASAPPPPRSEPSPSKSTSTSAPASPSPDADADDTDEPVRKESQAQQAASLHEQARIAAKKKDCTRVLALGQQIRKLDGAYYDRKFLSDDALKSCRASANKKGL